MIFTGAGPDSTQGPDLEVGPCVLSQPDARSAGLEPATS
jgi:hypothetical protein